MKHSSVTTATLIHTLAHTHRTATNIMVLFLIPFYLQVVHVHLHQGGKRKVGQWVIPALWVSGLSVDYTCTQVSTSTFYIKVDNVKWASGFYLLSDNRLNG
jgi:hypothetical protein